MKMSKTELEDFLKDGFVADGQPNASSQEEVEIMDWIALISKSTDLSEEICTRLQLLKDVYALTAGNLILIRHLLRRAKDPITTLAQIVYRNYDFEGFNGTPKSTIEEVQSRMFAKEPMAVVQALIHEGDLLNEEDEDLTNAVFRALNEATKKGISILSDKFRNLIYSDQFFEPLAQGTKKKPKPTIEEVLDVITALQRLQYVVANPKHIGNLWDEGFRSAHHVAVQSKPYFTRRMLTAYKMLTSDAQRIHDHATAIDCRNQETWVNMLSSINNDFIVNINKDKNEAGAASSGSSTGVVKSVLPSGSPTDAIQRSASSALPLDVANGGTSPGLPVDIANGAVSSVLPADVAKGGASPKTDSSRTAGSKAYNLTDMFGLQSSACEDCCSVTGPSAYFVDLLEFLQSSPLETQSSSDPKNVLEALNLRRPDLLQLELSCANCKNKLPYICIVNEVLESYISSTISDKKKLGVVEVVNEKESALRSSDGGPVSEIGASPLYQNQLGAQKFPLKIFPYNQALDSIRLCLSKFNLTLQEIISTFHSESRILASINTSSVDPLARRHIPRQEDEIYSRAVAASILNLQPDDFSVICGEHIFPDDVLKSSQPNAITKPSAHELWGYKTVEAMCSSDEKQNGLCHIRTQFLPRSGLSFEELCQLLSTLYFGRRLVIVDKSGRKAISDKVSNMRLRSLDISTRAPISGDEPPPPVGDLTDKLCFELQSFIRLRNKCNWTIPELDAAISCLSQQQVNTGATGSIDCSHGISVSILKSLASVVKLSTLVKMSVSTVLPLWGDIDTHDKNSFYEKLFFSATALSTRDRIFHPGPNDKFLNSPDAIGHHGPILQAVLKVSAQGLLALRKAAFLGKASDELTLSNVSKLYRYRLLCDMLRIQPENLGRALEVFPPSTDFFASPSGTLKIIESWSILLDNGWSAIEVIDMVRPKGDSSKFKALKVTSSIGNALHELRTTWETRINDQNVIPTDVEEICGRLFDKEIAGSISTFLQGLQTLTNAVVIPLGLPLPKPEDLPKRVTISETEDGASRNISITLKGILSVNEKALINEALRLSGNQALISSIEDIAEDSQRIFQAIVKRLFSRITDDQQKKVTEVLSKDLFSLTLKPGQKAEAEEQRLTRDRCTTFAKIALPSLEIELLERMLFDSVKKLTSSSNLKSDTYQYIWSELQIGINQKTLNPSQLISSLDFSTATSTKTKAGYIFLDPPGTSIDLIKLYVPNQEEPIKLEVDGVTLTPGKSPSIGQLCTNNINLSSSAEQTGEFAYIESSVGLGNFSWSLSPSGEVTSLKPSQDLFDSATVEAIASLLRNFEKLAKLLSKTKLEVKDVKYLQGEGSGIKFDLANPELSDLIVLEQWRQCASASKTNTTASLADTLQALSTPSLSLTVEQLASQLADAMGWPEQRTLQVLQSKYGRMEASQIAQRLHRTQALQELISLEEAMRILKRTSGRIPVSLLFQIATPSEPGQLKGDFENATALQLCLNDGQRVQCAKSLREKKRTALVEYLLQQDDILKKGIVNADGLFEYFLIDVQMGSLMETTRMKQALSTVQLYVQRCLLGMEVKNHVPSSKIKQSKWAWMQGHSIWTATRRSFLYPENWLDPSLRDDKTPIFEEYESQVMQKDFSWNTFVAGMKKYVYRLSTIADLDIQSYLRDNQSGISDTYHFFGRTRSAPYSFFHRKVYVDRKTKHVVWSPWSKMELDTLTYEADWNGQAIKQSGNYLIPVMQNNRLFLYLPQIMVKTQPADQKNREEVVNGKTVEKPPTFTSMANREVNETVPPKSWEIRMAWTELLDGNWTPKQLSQSSLIVDWDKAGGTAALPSLAHFAFDVKEAKADKVVIAVGCWREEASSSFFNLGEFCIREDRIIVSKNESQDVSVTKSGSALPVTFQKCSFVEKDNTTKLPIAPPGALYAKGQESAPLLAVPYPNNPPIPRTLTWTLSYGADKTRAVTGLVVDEVVDGKKGASTFFYPKEEDLGELVESDTLASQSNSALIAHGYARQLIEAACKPDGLRAVLDFATKDSPNGTGPLLDFGEEVSDKVAAGRHELTTPYAVYNWELGLHTVLLAMDRFLATQQFDLALQAARLVFDPTVEENDAVGGGASTACWKFPPFKEVASKREKMNDQFIAWPKDSNVSSSDLGMAVTERRTNLPSAHSTARGRSQAYMKFVIFKYIEILVAAGDEFFRRNSLETLPVAIQRYVEAAYVLGPEPPKVPQLGKPKTQTFAGLKKNIDLEISFPFLCDIKERGKSLSTDDATEQTILCIMPTTYFCLPANPKYRALRDLVNDRLYKTRNNLDINGRPLIYSIDEPYLDPADLLGHGLTSSGSGLSSIGGGDDGPIPFYRFQFLVSKAQEACGELKAMSEQLMVVKEKRDVEALTLLRSRQELTKQNLVLDLKQSQRDELTLTLESLTAQREGAVSQLKYYMELIGEPLDKIPVDAKAPWEDIQYQIEAPTTDHLRMNPQESEEMKCTEIASGYNLSAAIMDQTVALLRLIPGITSNAQPMGMGVTLKADAGLFADCLTMQSQSMRMFSMIAGDQAAKSAKVATLTRQLQERRLQANMKGREIKGLDKQIEIQKKKLDLHDKETAMQKKEIEHADELDKWYKSKYSGEKLYIWMENSIRSMLYDLYTLVFDNAKRAERAFRFERQTRNGVQRFINKNGYWQSSRDGLLGAQHLGMDLRRMEIAYLEDPGHDFQITKTVSLRQTDPLALLRFRENGETTFNISELLYDMDFPGHYMRRLKTVSVSIPCLIGPHTSIAGTLTLMEHKYRVSDLASSGAEYTKPDNNAHFRTDRIPITSVAISSGTQDSGLFELNFRDERLVPFEGAGAVSTWKLELPSKIRQFDYHTISDVVLHIKYTSLGGGPLLKQAVNEAVDTFMASVEDAGTSNGLFAFFDLKNDFSNEWYALQSAVRGKTSAGKAIPFSLHGLKERMPYWVKAKQVKVQNVTVVVSLSTARVDDAGVDETAVSVSIPTIPQFKWTGTEVVNGSTVFTGGANNALLDGWTLNFLPTITDLRNISLVLKYAVTD